MAVLGPVDRACLEHVVVWLDGVEAWELKLVVTEQLAVWKLGVGSSALLWEGWVALEDLKFVDVTRAQFSSVEVVVQDATCLPDCSNERTADIGAAVSWLLPIVDPAVLLNHSHHVFYP